MGNLTIEQCRKAVIPVGQKQAKLHDGIVAVFIPPGRIKNLAV